MDKFALAFKQEALELLSELEASLLELEENPNNQEIIDKVFRAMHTIKGSSGMFGFDGISKFTHEVETVFDLVREGEIEVTANLINLTLAARDLILNMLEDLSENRGRDESSAKKIISGFREIIGKNGETEESLSAEQPDFTTDANFAEQTGENWVYWIRFKPTNDIFLTGTNPLNLLAELRSLGNCNIIAYTDSIPVLSKYNPDFCYTWWDIILVSPQGTNAIRDTFIFVEDHCELKIEAIADWEHIEDETVPKKLGEILVRRGDLSQEDLQAVLQKQKRIGELLIDAKKISTSQVQAALTEQQVVRENKAKKQRAETVTSIRVPSERLDNLVNLVGEIVVVQARLSQIAAVQNHPELNAISEEVERLVGELRDNAMSLRMLPIGTTFSKFKRLVRDLANDLGKEVELITEGAETELDKTVIERLNDPLVHIIRNCLDHGIEMPEEREAAGKPRKGRVKLSALHSGANVLIQISDDGKGLDTEAIRAKAIEKGLLARDAELSTEEIYALIFAPGFSTSANVTNLSGRGVGMDVVKRNIESLRGSVEIWSEKGVGTTITIRLPLTLAIIEGLQIELAEDHYVLPLSIVEECIELTREDIARSNGRHVVNVRGEIIPYIRLREWFEIPGNSPAIEQAVIVNLDDKRVGLVVDCVIGEHQTVIKSLGSVYQKVEGISGATIRGDGTVALILDAPKLVQAAEEYEQRNV